MGSRSVAWPLCTRANRAAPDACAGAGCPADEPGTARSCPTPSPCTREGGATSGTEAGGLVTVSSKTGSWSMSDAPAAVADGACIGGCIPTTCGSGSCDEPEGAVVRSGITVCACSPTSPVPLVRFCWYCRFCASCSWCCLGVTPCSVEGSPPASTLVTAGDVLGGPCITSRTPTA